MMSWDEIFPPFGVVIRCGPVELRTLSPNDIPPLLDVALAGIYDDGRPMPFISDWAEKPADELPLNSTRWYWTSWASFAPERWELLMVVRRDGEIVGCQDLRTSDFAITRLARTGSWLGRAHQGRGTGTLMRQAICAFAFDELGASEMRTEAFSDNPRSRRVSEKIGYTEIDRVPFNRQGALASEVLFRLTPETFNRPSHPVETEGADAFRRFIGLSPA